METSVQCTMLGAAHRALGIGGQSPTEVDREVGTGSSKRPRKERGPKWSAQEVHALIATKREVFRHELNTVAPGTS